jgi:hypothetical protein
LGFQVTALGVRTGPKIAIDRVNMFAPFWWFIYSCWRESQVFLILQGNKTGLGRFVEILIG